MHPCCSASRYDFQQRVPAPTGAGLRVCVQRASTTSRPGCPSDPIGPPSHLPGPTCPAWQVPRWAMVADGLSIWRRREGHRAPEDVFEKASASHVAPAAACALWPMPTPRYCVNCHVDLDHEPREDALSGARLPTTTDIPERNFCSKECQGSHTNLGKRKAEAEATRSGRAQPGYESEWWRALTTTSSTVSGPGTAPADAGTVGAASFSFGFASDP